MEKRIMFIEHKTNKNHKGDAWIGLVNFSKSGQTIYFNEMAFKKIKKGGIWGNYCEIESGDEYWISGIKKNGFDRHWAGSGKIKIEKKIIPQYLNLVDFDEIDEANFEIVEIQSSDITKFHKIENSKEE